MNHQNLRASKVIEDCRQRSGKHGLAPQVRLGRADADSHRRLADHIALVRVRYTLAKHAGKVLQRLRVLQEQAVERRAIQA